jgi:hypothetical protein
MSKIKRQFTTTAVGAVPPGVRLEPNTVYAVAPRTPPAARSMKDRDALVSWIWNCVLGDLRTLRAGINVYLADEGRAAESGLAGANFLLAAGCCLALEYFARIYHGSDHALENVRQYTKEFLKPINLRYEEACDLLWRSFRNGIIHSSWPQTICIESDTSDRIEVGVGVKPDDAHLSPDPGYSGKTMIVNAVRFLEDLEVSVKPSFADWIRKSSDDAVLERAAPRLLIVKEGDPAREQLRRVMQWKRAPEGAG